MSQEEVAKTHKLRIATYNIHRCRGLDGRTKPERIAEVLAQVNADIIALQEVIGASPLKPGHAAEIGASLGMGWVMAPTRHLRNALFGNVVLSHFPVKHHQQYDLSWKTCEPRLCQRVDLQIDGDDVLHFYNVHLGTALLERREQAQKLAGIVHDRRVAGPKIVLGDFNEWARGLATDVLAEKLHSIDLRKHLSGRRRTYPGFFPVLHLDHIYYEGARVEVEKVWLPKDRLAMMASDHLPLVADLKLRFTVPV
jgi:endonuclease/exonuclease/phosphatase family metal-dependent hydrolase